jgi:RimJ/RimL family protein N-acetyltransferase
MRVPRVESPRLTLRAYEAEDFEAFASLNADQAVRAHVGEPLSRYEARRLFDTFVAMEDSPSREAWAVVCKDTEQYIGHCWLVLREGAACPEIGFLIDRRHWGCGYGTEVARAVVDYALRQAGYTRIVATVDPDNAAALRVLERAGMRRGPDQRDDKGRYFMYYGSIQLSGRTQA